jgi:hypothetical protein
MAKLTQVDGILGNFSDQLAKVVHRKKCYRKQRHFTRRSAEAQMRSILKRDLEKDRDRIHVYECPECTSDYDRDVFHVGHGWPETIAQERPGRV